MIITLVVSLGFHVVAVVVALLLLHAAVPVADLPDKATEVELVMEEHKGDLAPAASTPSTPRTATAAPPKQPTEPTPPPAVTEPAETPTPPAKPAVDAQTDAPQETTEPASTSTPIPRTNPTPEQQTQEQSTPPRPPPTPPPPTPPPPTPPPADPAPKITLQGTDSPSDARAWGDHIIPASPDAVFHNRPPEYPAESVLRGEHGTVVVVVHISPAGTAEGVDLLRSSGYALLDGAVRVAVMRWRFLPAVKAGASVASDVTMGFIFADN
jgi:protein TonB